MSGDIGRVAQHLKRAATAQMTTEGSAGLDLAVQLEQVGIER